MRRLAQSGGRSTMCVYSKFQGRAGLLAAIYSRAREEFLGDLDSVQPPSLVAQGVDGFASHFRRLALARSGRYEFLLIQPLSAISLPAAPRQELIASLPDRIAGLLDGQVRDRRAHRILAAMHGLIGFELSTDPLPVAGARVLAEAGAEAGDREAVRALVGAGYEIADSAGARAD